MMKKVLSKDSNGKGIAKSNALPKKFYILILILSVIFIFLYLYRISVLEARDFSTHRYLKSWIMKDDETFTISYTHSVELCPVTETYLIKDREIILTETYFESFGAGLPATTPYTFEMKNNGFRIYNINEVMDNLIYRTGAERANHKLIYKNKTYKFLDFSEPRTGVKFQISGISLLAYIIKEWF